MHYDWLSWIDWTHLMEMLFIPICILAASLTVGIMLNKLINRRIENHLNIDENSWFYIFINALRGVPVSLCLVVGLYWIVNTINIIEPLTRLFSYILFTVIILSITRVAARTINGFISLHIESSQQKLPKTTLLNTILNVVIYAMGVLVVLQYYGISIAPILTAMGVGGMAVALALQETLANIFSGLHLILSKQLRLDDYIKLSTGEEGRVTDITWRFTTIVPAGGGGLLAGVAACIKQINPRVQVIGVQAEGADAIAQSFRTHSYVQTDSVATIADGIAVKAPGDITVPLIQKYADDVVTVSDLEISEAVLLLMERCKQIVEPSGAAPVAAVLKGKVDVKGKNVVCLLSGGNIDVSFIQCIIEQGLVSRHRRLRFTVTLLDRPGSLGKLLNDIAALGANILSVEHDRLAAGLNPNEIDVHVSCEVGGKEHGDHVLDQLIQTGYHVKID